MEKSENVSKRKQTKLKNVNEENQKDKLPQ